MEKENILNEINDINNRDNDNDNDRLTKELENLKIKLFKQNVEINNLNNKIKINQNKIANTIRLKTEIDTLKKEKSKYKSDILELKQLYEEQINELYEKLEIKIKENENNEVTKSDSDENKETTNNSLKEEIEELKRDLMIVKHEKKFLLENNQILIREQEKQEKLNAEYIKKLKDDLENSENLSAHLKLNQGQLVFEQDTEIVKYKRICNKWKKKYQNLQILSNNKNIEEQTPNKNYMSNVSNSSILISNENSTAKKNLDSNMKENTNIAPGSSSKEYATNVNVPSSTKKSFFDKLFN